MTPLLLLFWEEHPWAGGVGTLGGTVIGVLIIGVLNNGMNLLRIDTYWQYVVKGVVILGAVYMDYIKRVRAAKK